MPSGRVHSQMTVVTSMVSFVSFYGADPLMAVTVSLGALTGVFLTPDLDLTDNFVASYNLSRFFVRRSLSAWLAFFLKLFWHLYWWPYGKIAGHRSNLSHFPVISTLVRVAYFGWPFLVLWFYLGMPYFNDVQIWWLILGLIISDIVHTLLDVLSSFINIKVF